MLSILSEFTLQKEWQNVMTKQCYTKSKSTAPTKQKGKPNNTFARAGI